jgi:hypothetical protein
MVSIPFREGNAYSKSSFLNLVISTVKQALKVGLLTPIPSVFLHAIFPSIENIPDKMGSKSALTSAQMMCFFIYWYVDQYLNAWSITNQSL